MKSTNPFIPSLISAGNPARVRTTVIVTLASQAVLMAVLLIQGCKPSVESQPSPSADLTSSSTTTNANTVAVDAGSNSPAAATNFASVSAPAGAEASPASNSIVPLILPPLATNDAPTAPATPALKAGTYVVLSGDSFSKIAKAAHVTIRALKAANPDVQPRRLKVGQILNLPDGSSTDVATSTASAPNSPAGVANEPAGSDPAPATAPATPTIASSAPAPTVYVVKAGDTLFRIARLEHTTVKRLRAINNLTSDKILLGQKLKLADSAQS